LVAPSKICLGKIGFLKNDQLFTVVSLKTTFTSLGEIFSTFSNVFGTGLSKFNELF
jgi:hypothetical protein